MADIRIAPATLPITPPTAPASISTRGGGDGFSETLTRAVSAVNEAQLDARDAAVAVASGTSGVDSAQAFVTIEKANIRPKQLSAVNRWNSPTSERFSKIDSNVSIVRSSAPRLWLI